METFLGPTQYEPLFMGCGPLVSLPVKDNVRRCAPPDQDGNGHVSRPERAFVYQEAGHAAASVISRPHFLQRHSLADRAQDMGRVATLTQLAQLQQDR